MAAPKEKPKDIRTAVKAELDFDPFVDNTNITVKNMGGDVALNGTVPSYPQYKEAAAAARRVNGVTSVHNHLMVTLPAADCRDDAMPTTAANNALTMNSTVSDGIEATATDGNIWLTGWVSYGFQRDAAESAVAGLTGVRNIQDDIEVTSCGEVADVTAQVHDALDRWAVVDDGSQISVNASDRGTLILAGHVRTWAEHDAVMGAAWMSPGVSEVRDDLLITG
jgi:osmotically-inducible protein OsmY